MLAISLPIAAALQFPLHPMQPGPSVRNTRSPSASFSEQVVCPACHKLSDAHAALASRPFGGHMGGDGDWFSCIGPADDQELTCFLAPGWMGLPEGQWVCSRCAPRGTLSRVIFSDMVPVVRAPRLYYVGASHISPLVLTHRPACHSYSRPLILLACIPSVTRSKKTFQPTTATS